MWLKEDITGLASGIEYGRKGDAVNVIDDCRDLILVEGNNGRFFCRPEVLSEEKVRPDSVIPTKQEVKKKRR